MRTLNPLTATGVEKRGGQLVNGIVNGLAGETTREACEFLASFGRLEGELTLWSERVSARGSSRSGGRSVLLLPMGRLIGLVWGVPLRRLSTHQTSWQKLELWGSKREVEMRVAGAVHAWWHKQRLLSGLAWDLIAGAALLRPAGPPKSVLMLGLAGGTSLRILRHLLPAAELTALEIDEGIVGIAREAMDLDALGLEIRITDAYGWLATNTRRFDVVIDDIYTAGADDVFRSREWSEELLGQLRAAVAPGGLLAVNLITGSGHRQMQSATRRVMRENFPVLRSLTTPGCLNEVLVGGDGVLAPGGLAGWRDEFPHPRDREFWDLMVSRRL